MRLAIVRQRYSPYGGAERFIERTLPALERAGAEVTLIARRIEGWNSGRVVQLDPFYLGSAWRDRSFADAARNAWGGGRFDLVQSHERIAGCDLYRAGDGVHRRWLDIRRESAGAFERLGIALSPHHNYVLAEERRMFEHPRLRAVICNSSMVRDEIAETFPVAAGKLHVIPNGVDLEHFHPRHVAALRAAARSGLGLAEGEFAFLYVGSGFARKGLDAAIRALARTEGGCVLLAAGRDRHAARFGALAQAAGVAGRVRLLGPREDVRPLYAAADCFILPTRYDPFPSAALEALAMGLPAIVGRRSGAAEALRRGRGGWICDPEDTAGLARLMQDAAGALAGGEAAPALRAAARSAAEDYGMDAMTRKLVDLYAALAKAG